MTEVLALKGDEHVLELNTGPGYFSLEIARRLTTGRLDMFDIQPEMLAMAIRKLQQAGHLEVGFHVGDAGVDLPFPTTHSTLPFSPRYLERYPTGRNAFVHWLAS